MKKTRLLLTVVLVAIISVILGLDYANAKYTSQVQGEVTASIAKYVFNVSATDSYSSIDTIENLVLAQTCNETTLIDKKIAPGTFRKF